MAPDGRILPCTYWPESHLTISDLEQLGEQIIETAEFQQARLVPRACQGCPCQGGCAGRRALLGNIEGWIGVYNDRVGSVSQRWSR